MNVLQRKMFAEGDLVNLDIPTDQDIVSKFTTASQLNPVTTTTRIIEQGGTFFAVKQNKNGDVVGSEPIDLGLSPTGDPREALQRQQRNKNLGAITGIGTALSLLPTAQTKIGGKIIGGLGNILQKTLGYSPIRATKLTGPGRTATGQFRSQSRFDPRSYKYELQTGPASVIGGTSLIAGSYGLQTDYDDVAEEKLEIAEELTALENAKTQKEIDNKTKEDDTTAEIVTSKNGTPDDAIEIDDGTEQENLIETREVKRQGMLDNPSFKSLLRNIGISMVETGDVGYGISQGSAQAVKDQIAAEAKELEVSDFDKFLDKEKIKNINKFQDKKSEYAGKLSESIFEVETSDAVLRAINEAKKLVQTGDATGLSPLFVEYLNQSRRFFGQDVKLSTRELAKNYINDIINGNIKELTGESGRTISNLDRQIAGSLVGKIEWSSSKENVIDKLDKAYARAKSRYKLGLTNYESNLEPYKRYEVDPPFSLGKPTIQSSSSDQQERIRIPLLIK